MFLKKISGRKYIDFLWKTERRCCTLWRELDEVGIENIDRS